jgi:hypothetical protein
MPLMRNATRNVRDANPTLLVLLSALLKIIPPSKLVEDCHASWNQHIASDG